MPDLKVTLVIALIMGGIIFSAAAVLDYRLAQIEVVQQ